MGGVPGNAASELDFQEIHDLSLILRIQESGLCPQLRTLYDTFIGPVSADLFTVASGNACMEIPGFVLKCLFLGLEALWMSSRALCFN